MVNANMADPRTTKSIKHVTFSGVLRREGEGGGRERNRMEKRRERDDNAVTLCAYGGAGSRRRRCRRRTDSNPYEKNDVGVSL